MTEFVVPSRDDHPAIESLLRASEWGSVDLAHGEVLVARDDGEIVGLAKMVDLGPEGVFVDDLVVHPKRRGAGIGADLMKAVMARRAGPVFLVCHDPRVAFYERLGFSLIEEEDLPPAVRDHAYRTDQLPSLPDHVHRLMRRDVSP